MKKALFLIWAFFLPFWLCGEDYPIKIHDGEFTVELNVHPTKITLDQPLEITLKTTNPNHYQFDLSQALKNLLNNFSNQEFPFTILNKEVSHQTLHEVEETTLRLNLDPLITGAISLSFYEFVFKLKENDQDQKVIASPIIKINVSPLAPLLPFNYSPPLIALQKNIPIQIDEINTASLNDYTQQVQKNLTLYRYKSLPWLELLAIGLIALFFMIAIKWPGLQQTSALTPLQAKEKLQKTLQNLLINERMDQSKNFFSDLNKSFREYLDLKYGLRTKSLTQKELMDQVQQSLRLSPNEQDTLTKFFQLTEKVLYADYLPSTSDLTQVKSSIEAFFKN